MNNRSACFFRNCLLAFILCLAAALPAQSPDFPPLDTLPVLDSLPDSLVQVYARRLADQGTALDSAFARLAAAATQERDTLEKQFLASKTDTLIGPDSLKALALTVKNAKSNEKTAQKTAQKAQKSVDFARKVAEMPPASQRKNLPKALKNLQALLPKPPEPEATPIAAILGPVAVTPPAAESTPTPPPPPADTLATTPLPDAVATPAKGKKEKKAAPTGPKYKAYDPAADVMLNPPARPCTLIVDTRDEFSGERRRETAKEALFRYTNPSLKAYFPDKEHILCDLSLAQNSGTFLLNLTFTVNDANARRSFGSLPRNGVAILKFLDGETFTVYNQRTDEGQPGAGNQFFTFRGQYAVDPGMLKKMQKALLDKIRIAWGTGYEDYEVQNADALLRQLQCLLKN